MLVPGVESEIIVGTYEDYVVGYQVENFQELRRPSKKRRENQEKDQCQGVSGTVNHLGIEQSFAVRSHSGSVKCLCGSSDGSLVFSAGQDEMMNLFSLKKRKLLQTLEGSITCSSFVENSHLLCGSDDGIVYIYECKSSGMELAKKLKGHSAGITSIDIHPTGKVLLTLSRDKTMRTWNLIKGRCAYVTYIKTEAHIVKWSRGGANFLIAADKDVYLYNQQGRLMHRIGLDRRVNSIEFLTDEIFVIATDSGHLDFFKVTADSYKRLLRFVAHDSRVKSVKCLELEPQDSTESENLKVRLVSASSDGVIKLWSSAILKGNIEEPIEIGRVDVGARITCMVTSTRRSNK